MAKVNKKQAIKRSQGLPTAEALVAHQGGDNVPAVIRTANGGEAPAGLTEGEYVWSIPAIIALGKGDHAEGTALMDQLHTELKAVGEQMMQEMNSRGGGQQQGLAGAAQLG